MSRVATAYLVADELLDILPLRDQFPCTSLAVDACQQSRTQ